MTTNTAGTKTVTENEILHKLILAFVPKTWEPVSADDFRSILTLGLLLALQDKDPLVSYKWMQENRLSLLSIPGFKCKIYENICMLIDRGEGLGLTNGQIRMTELLKQKLKPLEGK